jgi:hypothetical protein
MDLTFKNTKMLVITGGLFLFLFASCKKDEQAPAKEASINFPSTLSLKYGESADLDIPADLRNQTDVTLSLEFTENENIRIDDQTQLYDQLAKAVTIDHAAGKVHVNSSLIYPNGATSATTGKKLPEHYQLTFVAGTARQTIAITVTPGRFSFKGVDSTVSVPYAYVLYSDTGATFDIETTMPLAGTSWSLDSKGADDVVSISGSKLQFKATAGDPGQKTEHTYDLVSTLRKDGFDIATASLRVIFIPQIKFFYGTYYPEYDLTIITNQVYIALSNAYVSAAPTLYPDKYKSTFSISGIEKDGQVFENKDSVLTMNEKTGAITVKKNTTLTAGSYKLTVKAVTTTGLVYTATMTLNMSKLEE